MVLLHRIIAGASRRLASKNERFTLAVTLGFALTAIGVLSVAVDARSGNAEGFLDGLFGGSLLGQQSSYAMQGHSYAAPRRRAERLRSAGRSGSFRSVARVRHRQVAGGDMADGSQLSRVSFSTNAQSVCVRTCDGFAFPVGTYHGASDLAAHEATCQSVCPGAATSLFVLPPNSDSIDAAVGVRTGQPYSKLPDAFHYTTVINEACSCHPAAGGRLKSLLHDFTLRRGDAVMTARGVRVFHGGAHYPFRSQDFMVLNNSPDISRDVRSTFKAIERASLVGNMPVAASKEPASAAMSTSATPNTGTKQLEHQASR